MPEIVLAINGQDCPSDDGDTAEEFEAIASRFFAPQKPSAIGKRASLSALGMMANHWHGSICIRAVPINEDALADPPAIAQFDSMREPNQSLRGLSLSMVKQYRRPSTQ
jgi:hypothetical protein